MPLRAGLVERAELWPYSSLVADDRVTADRSFRSGRCRVPTAGLEMVNCEAPVIWGQSPSASIFGDSPQLAQDGLGLLQSRTVPLELARPWIYAVICGCG